MYFLLKSVYLYALSLWAGSMFFFTAVGAPLAFKALSEKEAGKYTGEVFPRYFTLGCIFGASSLASFYLLIRESMSLFSALNLLFLFLANIFVFLNGLFVVPKASQLKFEYYSSGEEILYEEFLKFHRLSMIFNVISLMLVLLSLGITSLYLTF